MAKRYTDEEREWVIANYRYLGPAAIAKIMGKKADTIKTYAKMLRDQFIKSNDERWKLLDSRGTMKLRTARSPACEIIKHYGNVRIRTNIDGKYGICPPWLVITDPSFNKTLNENWGRE